MVTLTFLTAVQRIHEHLRESLWEYLFVALLLNLFVRHFASLPTSDTQQNLLQQVVPQLLEIQPELGQTLGHLRLRHLDQQRIQVTSLHGDLSVQKEGQSCHPRRHRAHRRGRQ